MQGKGDADQALRGEAWKRLRAWLRPHLPALLLGLLLMLVQSGATLAQPWLGGQLTDRLLLDQGLGSLLWLLFALICAQQGLGYLVGLQLQKASGRLVADASAELYAHVKPAMGGTCTDVAMWVFCPFNGPARFKLGPITIPLGKTGQHTARPS